LSATILTRSIFPRQSSYWAIEAGMLVSRAAGVRGVSRGLWYGGLSWGGPEERPQWRTAAWGKSMREREGVDTDAPPEGVEGSIVPIVCGSRNMKSTRSSFSCGQFPQPLGFWFAQFPGDLNESRPDFVIVKQPGHLTPD
jgi:hypothetical protein